MAEEEDSSSHNRCTYHWGKERESPTDTYLDTIHVASRKRKLNSDSTLSLPQIQHAVKVKVKDLEDKCLDENMKHGCSNASSEIMTALIDGLSSKVVHILNECNHARSLLGNDLKPIFLEAIKQGNLFICQYLLIHDDSLKVSSICLLLAAEKGMVDIMRFLTYQCLDQVNEVDENGNTPFMLCQNGPNAYAITKLLLKTKKVKINLQNKDGQTALMMAVLKRNSYVIDYLISDELVDTTLVDIEGRTAISIANSLGFSGLIESLQSPNPYAFALESKNVFLMKNLVLTNSLDIDEHVDACYETTDSTLTQLFNSKLKPYGNTKSIVDHHDYVFREESTSNDDYCFSPFSEIEMEMMKILLKNYADICHSGSCGTPLMMAVSIAIKNKNSKVLDFMMEHSSCYMDHSQKCFEQAISIAVKNNRPDTIKCMVNNLKTMSNCLIMNNKAADSMANTEAIRNTIDLRSAAEHAVEKGFKTCVNSLIGLISNDVICTLICFTARSGNFDMYTLLKTALDVRSVFNDYVTSDSALCGPSWLRMACCNGSYLIAEDLLTSGVDIKSPHLTSLDSGLTLIELSSSPTIAKLLIQFGFDLLVHVPRESDWLPYEPQRRTDVGTKMLIKAIKWKSFDLFQTILDKGAQIDLTVVASYLKKEDSSEEFHDFFIKFVCDDDSPVNRFSKSLSEGNFNLMFLSIFTRKTDFIEALILKGGAVNVKWRFKDLKKICKKYETRNKTYGGAFCTNDLIDSPLAAAIMTSNLDVVKLLVENGANIHGQQNQSCHPPICCAVEIGNIPISEFLFDCGADVNAASILSKETAVAIASRQGHFELLNLLIGRKSDINLKPFELSPPPLVNAVIQNHYEIAQFLLKKGAAVNVVGSYKSDTPLMEAVTRQSHKMIALLIDNGAEIDIFNTAGQCPLLECIHKGSEDILDLLLKKGANVNITSRDEPSALMDAYLYDKFNIFETLIKHGANVNKFIGGQCTLLTYFLNDVQSFKHDFIKCVVSNGGDISKTKQGYIHEHIASNKCDIVSSLTHSGNLAPTVISGFEDFDCLRISSQFFEDFQGILSPLCMALFCGHIKLAEGFLGLHFVTTSDLTILPTHEKFRDSLQFSIQEESLNILDNMVINGPNLFQLAFVQVSDSIGKSPGRKERVKNLHLPSKLEKALLFTHHNEPIECAPEQGNQNYARLIKGLFEMNNYVLYNPYIKSRRF